MHSGKRLLGAVVAVDAAAFALFFALAMYEYSADRVAPVYALRWEIYEALLRLLSWLPGLQFLAVATALGSAAGKAEDLVGGALLPAAILSALLGAAAMVAGPPLSTARESILSSTSAFNASLSQARHDLAAGLLGKARTALETCMAIDGGDARVAAVAEGLAAAELKAIRSKPKAAEVEAPGPSLEGADAGTARAYYLKALDFAAKRDYFNAHSYASAAARLDPSYTDATRLAATSWERLAGQGRDDANREQAAFFARKLEGYGLLRSNDPIGAYRIFSELSAARGGDPDVRRYLAESLGALENAAFFKEEADRAFGGAALGSVFLRLPGPGVRVRILVASSAAWTEEAMFMRELEYIESGPQGPAVSVRAPLAKLSGGKLLLASLPKGRASETERPVWKAGRSGAPTTMIELGLTPDAAFRATAARSAPGILPFMTAWKAAGEAPNYGIDPRRTIMELISRTAAPFGLFTASALGVLAGVRFRKRSGSFRRGHLALVPLMALALVPPLVLAERVDAYLAAWAVRILPGLGALAVAGGLRALVLLLSVLLMAGARDDHGQASSP